MARGLNMNIKIASPLEMPSVFALRFEVFVDEQNVPPEIELDSEDKSAVHIMAEENGSVIGCARVIFTSDAAHLGRLAVKKNFRGRGIGADICRYIIELCKTKKCARLWLNSQLHAVGFYKKLGFEAHGETFFEAGIEHIEMELML